MPQRQLEQKAGDLLSKLTELAPLTLRATRQLVNRVTESTGARAADDIVREVYGSRDFREGVTAFREKRPPEWEGR